MGFERVQAKWRIDPVSKELFVFCPGCGREMATQNHRIEPDTGQMIPSFMCPWDKVDGSCNFHDSVSLYHWWERSCMNMDIS